MSCESKELHYFSSGGAGDALIVGMKISKIVQEEKDNGFSPVVYWDHAERHPIHQYAIIEIMKQFSEVRKCHIISESEKTMKDKAVIFGGTYLDTKVVGHQNPYLASKIGESFTVGEKPHVVINTTAGRITDNTKRVVGPDIFRQVAAAFPDRKVILIGPEVEDYGDTDNILNRTGQTESIIDAFSYINRCCLFVGHDGVLAYYAMMLRKPTIIHFHIQTLINHYYNWNWAMHSIALIGGENMLKKLNTSHPETELLFEVARKAE